MPITIVLYQSKEEKEVREFAESKNASFAKIRLFGRRKYDPTQDILNALSELVGRVLPNLGTDRVLQAPPKTK